MAQTSGPISQGTTAERQFSDVLWRDRFGDEPGVIADYDGSAYKLTLPSDTTDVLTVGSSTQASIATVAGFVHKIASGTPEPLTIPDAVGSARTDIISLRYDPAYTGAPGPVRLFRIAGTSSAVPVYDAAPPGVEDLPLWAITRQPSQNMNLAAVVQMFPRIAPSMGLPVGATLPTSSPLETTIRQGSVLYRRVLSGGVPVWTSGESDARGYLGDALGTALGTVTTLATILSLSVTIPAGLSVGRRIKVEGGAFVATGAGQGATIEIQGGSSRIFNEQNIRGDCLAYTRYDGVLTAGSRTYNLRLSSSVSSAIEYRHPFLRAEIV